VDSRPYAGVRAPRWGHARACLALAGCGGRQVPDGYSATGHLACSPGRPAIDVHALIGQRLVDARRVTEKQGCLLRVTLRDGEASRNAINLLADLLDVAVADGKLVGVARDPDR
jgi:hypothetical protein